MFRDNVSIVDGSGKKAKRTQIERILVLLLESGILYFLFFVGPLPVLSPAPHLKRYAQVTQIVLASPPVHARVESVPGLVFALKIYTYSTSVIVVR
jgi:hypothetical protein